MKHSKKHTPLAVAVGAALTATLAASPVAADANPFGLTELASGYMVAAAAGTDPQQAPEDAKDTEGRCGEGKCGEGRCGEGNCGSHDKDEDAEAEDEDKADAEGRCGGTA